jgi:hypothetical protein
MFNEAPRKDIVEIFNTIGNPVSRLSRMDVLISSIINKFEVNLNINGDSPDHRANYRVLPKEYDQIFHQDRRKSSNDMNDSSVSLDAEDPSGSEKEENYL